MADTNTAATAAAGAVIPENFTNVYEQLKQKLLADTATLDYKPQTRAQLKADLQAALLPGLESSITDRNKSYAANNAAIDADAAARGIGSSSWVTDVKNRNANNQQADITNLRGSYNSTLASNLASLMGQQEDRRMNAEQYNNSQKASALSNALSLALDKYKEWGAPAATGGTTGGGSGGKESGGSSGYWWNGKRYATYAALLAAQKSGGLVDPNFNPTDYGTPPSHGVERDIEDGMNTNNQNGKK